MATDKSVILEREGISPGVVFEPLKEPQCSFLYGTYLWCAGNDQEATVMFTTHRVVLRGQHLESLPEYFGWQQVRRVRALVRAQSILTNLSEPTVPVVTEITIEQVRER